MATHLLHLLTVILCIIFSSSAQEYVSIDCGSSSESYQDANLINWSGDNGYVNTGEPRMVPSNNSISTVIDTLRVFNNGRNKICYTIDSIRKGKVLLRASFYYGNYDGRSSPPSFDLHYDGNYWDTVDIKTGDFVYHEVIYVMKSDSISVCVAQTREGEYPFISALVVRRLESSMYRFVGIEYPLVTLQRLAYGSTKSIRYGDDPYDRIWRSVRVGNGSGLIEVTNNMTFDELTAAPDRPPRIVLQHAITAISPNTVIILPARFLNTSHQVYINWYFSEVTQLEPNETRSFEIFLGDKLVSHPILPPYQNSTEWTTISNHTVSSNTTITLVPTNDSTLAPLINAMEVFLIGVPLTNGTNSNDVQGLVSLQSAFSVLDEWKGDPCLPAPYSWDWIQCNNDTRPRVTALILGSFGLSGVLPDFRSMDALHTVDLHNNSIHGPIPDFLGTLPDLTELNVANNQFNGSIPASLSHKTGLNLVVTGNSGLCNTSSNSSCPATRSLQSPSGIANAAGSEKKKKNTFHVLIDTLIFLSYVIWFIYHA